MGNFHQNGKNIIKTPIKQKKRQPLLGSEYNENEQRQHRTKAALCQHQYQKLQYTMWCLITRSLWRGSGGEPKRTKKR